MKVEEDYCEDFNEDMNNNNSDNSIEYDNQLQQ